MLKSQLKKAVWNLQYDVTQVMEELVENEKFEDSSKFRRYIVELRLYSLLMEYPFITTVVGAQGVGKSTHINQMFEIPENQKLIDFEGRAEQIPVFIFEKKKDDKTEVQLYKKNYANSEIMYFEYEEISYEEARKKTQRPENDDLCLFWFVDSNERLSFVEPLVMLPGHEIDSPWQKANKIITEFSDIIIYTFDMTRLAQRSGEQIEGWIKNSNITNTPIALGTKNDMMNPEQRKELKEKLNNYNVTFVGCWEGKDQRQKKFGEYDSLFNHIQDSIKNVYDGPNLEKLKNLVIKIHMRIKQIRKQIELSKLIENTNIKDNIDKHISEMSKFWENNLRAKFVFEINDAIIDAQNYTKELTDDYIVQEIANNFGDSIKLWWNGGLLNKEAILLENFIREKFQEKVNEKVPNINQNYKQISQALSNEIRKDPKKENISNIVMKQVLVDYLASPIYKVEEDNISLSSVKDSFKETIEAVNEISNELEPQIRKVKFNKYIKSLSEKDRKKFDKKYIKLLKKNDFKPLSAFASSGTAALATGEVVAETLGGGLVVGTAGSIAAAIASGAIATAASLILVRSVAQYSNKTQWQIRSFAHEMISIISENVRNEVDRKLNFFWKIYKDELRRELENATGLEKENQNSLNLAIVTNDTRNSIKTIMKILNQQ